MPKERKDSFVSNDKYRASPLCCDSSRALLHSSPCPTGKDIKEWEEVDVLSVWNILTTASFSFALHMKTDAVLTCATPATVTLTYSISSVKLRKRQRQQKELQLPQPLYYYTNRFLSNEDREKAKPKLTCPLCRGDVKKWVVVQAARCFMNSKLRSCSCETCDYSGTYSDLRKHARVEHPKARPSEADPQRELSWRRLEQQRGF